MFGWSPAYAYSASCQELRDLGDQLTVALPLSAYALTAGYKDANGAGQYTKTLLYTGLATGFFKEVGGKERPDAGTSQQSFVSGHVSSAMSAAAFIYTRYGKGWGIPAYALAGVTAYSRACAQKHFDDDILGGTMVALMSNWYATSPYPGQSRIYPSFSAENDIMLTWDYAFSGNRQPRDPASFRARYKFTFEFGPLYQETNLVQSPNGTGTLMDFASLEENTAPTARLLYEYFPKRYPNQDWSVYYSPLGITDYGNPTQPFDFAGETFDPADSSSFNSNYRWFDWRFRWRTALFKNQHWTLRAGAGLQYTYTQVDIEQDLGTPNSVIKQVEVKASGVGPVIHGSAEYHLTPKWSFEGQLDGMDAFWDSRGEYYWNAGLFVKYAATQLWEFGFGGRWLAGKTNDPELYNKFESTDFTFILARSF
ncbi:MAG: phosphatase PAP2 family protein [Gammaproteobacteria bacterium]